MSDTAQPDNEPAPPATPPPEDAPPPPPARTDGELWLETGVVLVIGVLTPLVYALMHLRYPETWPTTSFTLYAWLIIIPQAGTIVTVLYLMARSGESWSTFGVTGMRLRPDGITAVGLLLLDFISNYYVFLFLGRLIGLSFQDALQPPGPPAFHRPEGFWEYLMVVAVSAAAGFGEELVMRGYLIPRFERLLGSTVQSVLLTSILFALYHVYQGWDGVLNCLVAGLLYGAFFCWLRRLWPLVVAHTLWDIIAYWRLFP